MQSLRRIVLLVGMFAAFHMITLANVYAATYYVDFSGGSDTNDGISISTPWKHCPGDANATAMAVSTTLTGGDTVIFKGGVPYLGQITIMSGASASSVVTYDGNTAGTFGTGNGIMDGNYVANTTAFTANNNNYFTIQHFDIRNYGGYSAGQLANYNCTTQLLPYQIGYGVYIYKATYATVQNCNFYQIGIWQNTQPVQGYADICGYGVRVDSGNNIAISNNDFTKMAYAVYLDAYNQTPLNLSTVTVSGNTIHDYVVWGVTVNAAQNSSTIQDIDINGNIIHDFYEFDTSGSSFCGTVPHTDFMMFYIGGVAPSLYTNNTLGTPTHPIKVHGNVFYQNSTIGSPTAAIFLTAWGGTMWIYDNTFVNIHPSGGGEGGIYVQDGTRALDNNPVLDYHFYNNTFYDSTYGVVLRSVTSGYELNRAGYVIDVQNNIFYDTIADYGSCSPSFPRTTFITMLA